jgi:hypothetical protein
LFAGAREGVDSLSAVTRLAFVALGVLMVACGRESQPAPSPKTNTGGAAGSSTGGSAGGPSGDLLDVARVLDGYVMKQPCVSASGARACRTAPAGACPVNEDPAYAGATPTRDTLSFGGMSGVQYDVTLHVQGIVESKVYRNGSDVSELATDGLHRAGSVDNARNQRSAFALRITAPTANYFFNALGRAAMRHSVFVVDYEATVTVQGGTPLEFWVSDPNCEALRNCGEPEVAAECTPLDIPNLEPKIRSTLGVAPNEFDGQFIGFAVKNVLERN